MEMSRRTWIAATALLASTLVGWTAQPIVAGGITIQTHSVHTRRETLFVRTTFINQSAVPIAVNRDLITVTLPTGQSIPRARGTFEIRGNYVIPPGGSHAVHFDFRSGGGFVWHQFSQLAVNWG